LSPLQAGLLALPTPGSARLPHVLQYAPEAVRWPSPVSLRRRRLTPQQRKGDYTE